MYYGFVFIIRIPRLKLLRRNSFARHWSYIVFIKQFLDVTQLLRRSQSNKSVESRIRKENLDGDSNYSRRDSTAFSVPSGKLPNNASN